MANWPLIGEKKGEAATPAPKGLGPQNSTKKVTHVGVLLGYLLSQNHVLNVSDLRPPPLKKLRYDLIVN